MNVNYKKMRMISFVWGFVLVSLVLGLTIIGLIYKKESKEYKDFESILVDKANVYITERKLEFDSIKITGEELVEAGLLDTLKVKDNECDAFVIVKNDSSKYLYKAYIKCDKYKTKGYQKAI